MQRITSRILAISSIMLLSLAAQAGSISLTPLAQTVNVGDTVIITISADFTGEPIIGGGFDVFYDGSVLDFLSFSFSNDLDDDPGFRRDPDDLNNELNGFAFAEFFGLEGQFVIGQISFVAIASGSTELDLAVNEGGLGPNVDGPTNPGPFVTLDGQILLDDDIDFNAASVQVVPLPAAFWFMLAGLSSLGVLRKRNHS